jgi:hypothetical protein
MPALQVPGLSNGTPGFCEGRRASRFRCKRSGFLVLCEMKIKFSLIWTKRSRNHCINAGPFSVPI